MNGVYKHQFTHKGAGYNYDTVQDNNNMWSGKWKQQSWLVKRKLLIDTIKSVYPESSPNEDNIAMTLYSIHRLRDLRFANTDYPMEREYFFNLPEEVITYTLPLIKSNYLLDQIKELNNKLKTSIMITKDSKKWDNGLSKILDSLLGPESSDEGGLISKVIPDFLKPEALTC
jgi:hypothetical protein